ncbi:MAG: hypothetical protein EA398_04805 [Deltaproteobacteria bacterium]|nr:MAG: hypothetical protein EA398_04805 [Deltaproteobacteria bacterium]
MSSPSWENVEALVASKEQERGTMVVTFQCPVSGETVEGRASLNTERSLKSTVKESFLRQLVWSLMRTVRRMLGYRMAGSIASDATRHVATDATEKARFSEADRQKAIVEAFERVQSQFRWDEGDGRWVHVSAASGEDAGAVADAGADAEAADASPEEGEA